MREAANDNVSLTLRMYEDCKRMGIDHNNLPIDFTETANRLVFAGQLSVRGLEFMLANKRPIGNLLSHAMRWNDKIVVRKMVDIAKGSN